MTRPRFALRTLLVAVALCAAGLYFRPRQLGPKDIKLGMPRWYVRWYCGPPSRTGPTKDFWNYDAEPRDIWIEFAEEQVAWTGDRPPFDI
jgi:hypothetical protein